MKILRCGPEAVLLDCGDLTEALGWWSSLSEHPEVQEAVLGAQTVLLRGDPRTLRHVVASTLPSSRQAQTEQRTIEIPVHYDGPDLANVASLVGLSSDDVVRRHTGSPWTVGFSGFAPGFAYLIGGDETLRVPRLPRPRTKVPSGSVGLAGEFSGVYPRESPGGWQLIGRTTRALFDIHADPPALLQPGDHVQFVEVEE